MCRKCFYKAFCTVYTNSIRDPLPMSAFPFGAGPRAAVNQMLCT